ncbi:4822_t:CDS:2 [Diversispora eburnea]|uniref:4822_t:CDS:1 n=1 Tax=Diversispora eburnea TaxID=1213867 RepID=A0A9N9B3T7_9GLOM|nr:4822_t:CDS:2 [Diversispora eburnea]
MILCAECKLKGVFMEPSGNPGEFCSNQCRKAAVEHGKVQGCAMCHIYPRVRLQNGSRSNYCGRQCQSRAQVVQRPPTTQSNISITSPTRPTPTIPVSGGIWVPVKVPLCLYCQNKPCWKDPGTQAYSSFCGRRCKEAFDAETPPSDPQLDLNQPPGLDKLNETKPNKNKRTNTLQSIDDDSELPPPYEPSDRDRYKNCSDRKITRDDSFDDENPYGTKF